MSKIKNDLHELFDKYYNNKQYRVLKDDQLYDVIKGDPELKKI